MKMDGPPRLLALPTSRRRLLGMFACAPIAAVAAPPASAASMERITFTPSRVYDRKAWEAAAVALDRAEAELVAASKYLEPFEQAEFDAEKRRQMAPSTFRPGDTVDTYNARIAAERDAVEVTRAASRSAYDIQADACDRACEAYDALMVMPAPDLLAALRKVELFIDHGACGSEIEAVAADLRRFAGVAA